MEQKRKYKLKELRARYDLTQEGLGELIGIQALTVLLYEKNPERLKRMPYEMMMKLCKVLGVSPDEIYMGEE